MPKFKITIEMDAEDENVAYEVYEILGQKIDDMYAEEEEQNIQNTISSFVITFDEP